MKQEIDETLAASLKQLRLAAGMTQEELAERAGLTVDTNCEEIVHVSIRITPDGVVKAHPVGSRQVDELHGQVPRKP